MKIVSVPSRRSEVVRIECRQCGRAIGRTERAVADLDARPRLAYYHSACVPPGAEARAHGRGVVSIAGRAAGGASWPAPRRLRPA